MHILWTDLSDRHTECNSLQSNTVVLFTNGTSSRPISTSQRPMTIFSTSLYPTLPPRVSTRASKQHTRKHPKPTTLCAPSKNPHSPLLRILGLTRKLLMSIFLPLPFMIPTPRTRRPKFFDVAIPTNNKARHSIGLLIRDALRLHGTISRTREQGVIMVDRFFYRDPGEVEKEQQETAEAESEEASFLLVPGHLSTITLEVRTHSPIGLNCSHSLHSSNLKQYMQHLSLLLTSLNTLSKQIHSLDLPCAHLQRQVNISGYFSAAFDFISGLETSFRNLKRRRTVPHRLTFNSQAPSLSNHTGRPAKGELYHRLAFPSVLTCL
jgi:hypothetical protein